MTERASAIIISKRHILLMHRIRAEREYYVFPGGRIEAGESAPEACVREVHEETGLRVAWMQPAFEHPGLNGMRYYFFVQVQPGDMAVGGPEALKQSGDNRYILEWVPLVQIGQMNLQPEDVRDALASVAVENGPVREARDLALRRERVQEILAGGLKPGSL